LKNIPKSKLATLSLLSILSFSVIAVSFSFEDVLAHTPFTDQSHTPVGISTFEPVCNKKVGQEFFPTANDIVGYDLKFTDGIGTGSISVNGTLWLNEVGGVGTAIGFVLLQSVTLTGAPQIVHFDFDFDQFFSPTTSISLTPGGSYWIEPNCAAGGSLVWINEAPGTYTPAIAHVDGPAALDFWFIEYSSAAPAQAATFTKDANFIEAFAFYQLASEFVLTGDIVDPDNTLTEFEVKIDGVAFPLITTPGSQPVDFVLGDLAPTLTLPLTDATHDFSVKITSLLPSGTVVVSEDGLFNMDNVDPTKTVTSFLAGAVDLSPGNVVTNVQTFEMLFLLQDNSATYTFGSLDFPTKKCTLSKEGSGVIDSDDNDNCNNSSTHADFAPGTPLTDGIYTWSAVMVDAAGNSVDPPVTWTVDNTDPAVTIDGGHDTNDYINATHIFTGTATDAGGISKANLEIEVVNLM